MLVELTLAALLVQSAPPARQIVQTTKCNAGKAQALLRRAADTSALAEAIRLSGSHNLRVLWPGDRLDADRNGDRLTIEVDASNKIKRLSCG